MAGTRKELKGKGAFTIPLLGVFLLVAFYLVLAEWQALPQIINSAIAAVKWPG